MKDHFLRPGLGKRQLTDLESSSVCSFLTCNRGGDFKTVTEGEYFFRMATCAETFPHGILFDVRVADMHTCVLV